MHAYWLDQPRFFCESILEYCGEDFDYRQRLMSFFAVGKSVWLYLMIVKENWLFLWVISVIV